MLDKITEDNFRSFTNKRWKLKEFNERDAELISQNYDFDYLLAKLFSIRNINVDEISAYINPSLKKHMPDPNILMDMEKGVNRVPIDILLAIGIKTKKENINYFLPQNITKKDKIEFFFNLSKPGERTDISSIEDMEVK